uniref:histone deacetylase n=1 Tax=Tetraselmis chuii TaxID=63592 RepID=A0A7S1SN95_9CHLO|mmetsp:Transcript_21152/g.37679  ORF Transcript_21152/g.37679 Transcript_21152/m.37679 type:complete len:312 (+) Transcript_21152:461-1396(+)
MDLFQNVLCKAVREYAPDLIILSAGFDGHKDDMFGFLRLSDNTYKKLTECVMDLADQVCRGRIVSVLEGGYTVQTLAQCCQVHVKALATHNQPASLKEARRQNTKAPKQGISGLDKLRRLRSTDSLASSRSSGGTSGTPRPIPLTLRPPSPANSPAAPRPPRSSRSSGGGGGGGVASDGAIRTDAIPNNYHIPTTDAAENAISRVDTPSSIDAARPQLLVDSRVPSTTSLSPFAPLVAAESADISDSVVTTPNSVRRSTLSNVDPPSTAIEELTAHAGLLVNASDSPSRLKVTLKVPTAAAAGSDAPTSSQ